MNNNSSSINSDSVGLLDSLELSTGRVVVHLVGLPNIVITNQLLH